VPADGLNELALRSVLSSLRVRNGVVEAGVWLDSDKRVDENNDDIKTPTLVAIAARSLVASGKKADYPTAIDNSIFCQHHADGRQRRCSNEVMATPASGGHAFVNMAAASDAFEIETSKLAVINGASAAVKKFAGQMITAHEGSTAKLKALTETLSPVLTPVPAAKARGSGSQAGGRPRRCVCRCSGRRASADARYAQGLCSDR
jgi:predicted outer membrane protein